MKTDFKVYKRKIIVFVDTSSNLPTNERTCKNTHLTFLHCTNAYPTCKAAIAALNPAFTYKAWFEV